MEQCHAGSSHSLERGFNPQANDTIHPVHDLTRAEGEMNLQESQGTVG